MQDRNDIGRLINIPGLDPMFKDIVSKIEARERINAAEGLLLFEKAPLAVVGTMANFIRERKHGDKTYFNRNFHIEPTNICVFSCKFCSYSRLYSKREEVW